MVETGKLLGKKVLISPISRRRREPDGLTLSLRNSKFGIAPASIQINPFRASRKLSTSITELDGFKGLRKSEPRAHKECA